MLSCHQLGSVSGRWCPAAPSWSSTTRERGKRVAAKADTLWGCERAARGADRKQDAHLLGNRFKLLHK